MDDFRASGIRNLGNTCYISAVVQCLYRCQSFRRNLMECGRVTHALKSLFDQMSTEIRDFDIKDPSELITALMHRPSSFLDYTIQNDAQEFLLEILDAIENECKITNITDATKDFYGKMAYLTQCQNCKNTTRLVELFMSISFTGSYPWSRESIDDFQCDKCLGRHKAEREGQILAAPKIMIIQVLRFENGRKLHASVAPPYEIDIGLVDNIRSRLNRNFEYIFRGVVCHKGLSLHKGHYYSIHPDPSKVDDMGREYICCDDGDVTRCDRVDKKETYVMFYEKK